MIRLSDISKNRRGEIQSIRKHNGNAWEWLEQVGLIIDNKIHNGNYLGVKDFWKDEPCWVVGAGPSLKGFDLKQLDGKHSIGINHVIEDYDGFEWFLFLDKRFLEKTTYNLENYKGRVFASNMTGLMPNDNATIFKTNNDGPTENIEDGLYGPYLSALCALNLAVISGADPIYLIGVDCGGGTPEDYHYKKDYLGIAENKERQKRIHKKYEGTAQFFTKFKRYKDRVINLSKHSNIEIFKKQPYIPKEIKIINKPKKKTGPKIAHMSFSNNIEVHADITRGIYNNGYGVHTMNTFDNVPKADLYFYEGFISTREHINNWPFKKKSIFIVHTMNVIPRGDWGCIVALTNAWKDYLIAQGIESKKIVVINGGIDLSKYTNCWPNYGSQVFGRMTRVSPGKWPVEMNKVILDILEELPKSKCILHFDRNNKATLPAHERFIMDSTVKINQFKGDALKKLSVYFHVNNTFKETLSFACIEAMAAGLPIVYKDEPAVKEVVGLAGICCESYDQIKKELKELLLDQEKQREYGMKAKQQVKKFDLSEKISQFDEIAKQVLNG
jgi:glycosyltransferase involved in cell wall biosynthesis